MVYMNNITTGYSIDKKIHEEAFIIGQSGSYNVSISNIDMTSK